MRFRVIAVVVVAIAAATWGLVAWSSVEETPLEISAPTPSGPPEVHFRVSLTVNGVPTRGDRVVLYALLPDGGFGTEVSGDLSATGEATMRVPLGAWRVARPGGAQPRIVTITATTNELKIIGGEYILSGRVLDTHGAPVVGVVVDCGGALVATDRSGGFAASFDTDDELTVSLLDVPNSQRLRVHPSSGPVELVQP